MQIQHEVQLGILKHLLFHPKSRFSELNEFNLDNNHFNFHLKRLLEEGIVDKQADYYQLTPEGLELAGRMDVRAMEIVRQPKLGVSICVVDDNGKILLGKRLKNPGQGVINFYTRKVRYGESLFETAKLCLKEETGLEAKFTYVGTVRFLEQEMDRLMICFVAHPSGGKLESKTLESDNKWYDYKEIKKLDCLFTELRDNMDKFLSGKLFFEEKR